jgi:AcrR family transcriptional regulator
MAEVAAELRLAKPTLYRLAGRKEQLVRACVDSEAERLLDHLHAQLAGSGEAMAIEVLTGTVRAVERYAHDSPGGFRLLFERRGPEAQDAIARLEAQLAALLRDNGRPAHGLQVVAAGLLGAATAVVARSQAAR